jgi:hypothetical protein
MMPDDTSPRIGNGGETFSPYSIRSRVAAETQERIDMIMRRESELGAYDADAVM